MTAMTQTASADVFDATQHNFETEVIQASLTTPILVDFWAAWCGPCKSLTPILEKVVASYAGAVRLAKVDTDAEMQLAAAFGIRSLPTVVLVKDGQMIDGFMGALPESGIREFLKRHIGDPAAAVEPAAAPIAPPEDNETPQLNHCALAAGNRGARGQARAQTRSGACACARGRCRCGASAA